MTTLVNQIFEAIEKHNYDLEDGQGTHYCDTLEAAKQAAIVSRNYAKRFAEWAYESKSALELWNYFLYHQIPPQLFDFHFPLEHVL